MVLETPKYNLHNFPEVYDPSEDSFLLVDALEVDAGFLLNLKPKLAVEIGSGSGVVISTLSQIFGTSCMLFATDVNSQACEATIHTASLNNTTIESVNMDLLSAFKQNIFDLILFNPPYVLTDPLEVSGKGLNRAWAGGLDGREIIDKFLCNLPKYLKPEGVCYLVILKENKPNEIVHIMHKLKFASEIVLQRKIPGECLYVYKFYRLDSR